ncbi:MAG: cytochrome c oxidase subunit 3 [Hyphomicrobiaceae bacterium]|nr:cytochrome c oxidase subunit 3 [Hyphomicrobiaceae bacterium]
MAKSHANQHDYHLVDPSPWPIIGGLSAFITAVGLIIWMRSMDGGEGLFGLHGPYVFVIGAIFIAGTMFVWWRDVIREAEVDGHHKPVVQLHLRYGMILFIASEVMFFVVWFWGFFDAALFPDEAVQVARTEFTGGEWPPKGTSTFNPWQIPLVNTLILLTSGTTVTWAHHALLNDDRRGLIVGLVLTIILGILFTSLQVYEYAVAPFSFSDSIYGATFFMATGFHGAHVIIGTIFLIVTLFRALAGHFTSKQHFGFEAAAWYWHFVDVVWLFLFSCIYVWAAGVPAEH